jgi:hypothetical protein
MERFRGSEMNPRFLGPLFFSAAVLEAASAAALPEFAADLSLDAAGYRLDVPRSPTTFALVGLGARGAVGTEWIGYRAGLDARLGAALEGGFAVDTTLYAIGFRVPVAAAIGLGVSAGIGVNGVTTRVEPTGRVPLELALDVAITRWLRTGARLTPAWVFAVARQDGSDLVSFIDEFDASFLVRVGKGNADHHVVWGNGFFVAAVLGERLGGTLYGLSIGHCLDMRSP